MLIGVPKEIKTNEYRVGLTPASARELIHHGQKVMVETLAGAGIGCTDEDYLVAGAEIVESAETIYEKAQMIIKVKEPQPYELAQLKEDQVLFAYLHLAANPDLTESLVKSRCTAIAYETITDNSGRLPCLAPMSEVAGRMAIQVGAVALHESNGGRGVLLGGASGVLPATVVVLGGGVVGLNAARMATGIGADVIIIDKSQRRIAYIDEVYGLDLNTLYATRDAIEEQVANADMVIGAALVPGASAPKLIRRSQLRIMRPGAVLVDVSIDQGGCFESSRPTTHTEPTFVEEGIVHYCVSNMPGAVPRTSTLALNNATLPFTLDLANKGWKKACLDDPHLMNGLNIHHGHVTHSAVAESLDYAWHDPAKFLS